MVTVLLVLAFAVFAAIALRTNEKNKREEVRIPLYIEDLRARRRRR